MAERESPPTRILSRTDWSRHKLPDATPEFSQFAYNGHKSVKLCLTEIGSVNLKPTMHDSARLKTAFPSLLCKRRNMARTTIEEFIKATRQDDTANDFFQLESDRMLEVNLSGDVWTKTGSMVAYVGGIKFSREGILERGVGNLLKKTLTGEGARLTKATGKGRLYLADKGKTVQILHLGNEALFVNGNDLLAFETSMKWDITMMKSLGAMVSSGLFNVRLQGPGMIAITTHFEPMTLLVKPGFPVRTDPNATTAWSGNLAPAFKTDVSLKTFFGRGSGESVQMEFNGDGFVVVQPFEESIAMPS